MFPYACAKLLVVFFVNPLKIEFSNCNLLNLKLISKINENQSRISSWNLKLKSDSVFGLLFWRHISSNSKDNNNNNENNQCNEISTVSQIYILTNAFFILCIECVVRCDQLKCMDINMLFNVSKYISPFFIVACHHCRVVVVVQI